MENLRQPPDELTAKAGPAALPIWKKALFALTPIAALVIATEGICRLIPSARPAEVASYVAQWDAQWQGEFWTLEPGPGINRDGLRDRDHPLERAPGTWRIAALGDSVTMGYGIDAHEAWPAQLERQLAERHEGVEVFNVSMMGWSARQERIAYAEILAPYAVDDVLLGVCLNDIAELQNNLTAAQTPRALLWLNRHSAAFRTLIGAHAREIARVEELFTDAGSSKVEHAWQLLFDEILELHARLRTDGVRLAVILFPFRFQVQKEAPAPIAQQRMAAFCEANGLTCFDALGALETLGVAGFVDYDHLSARGSRKVARQLLKSGILVPPRP